MHVRGKLRKHTGFYPVVAMALLIGMGLEWLSLPKPASADAYHRRVRLAADQVPMRIGAWVGQDVPIPSAAVKMLSPNAVISRRYTNVASGLQAELLLVQVSDARDIVAHYPPVCMVNAGWTLSSAMPRDWVVGDIVVHGTEYQFNIQSIDRSASTMVCNFMVLPDGPIVPNMDAVDRAAENVARRYFGAAEVQLVMSADSTRAQRDDSFVALIAGMKETLQAIRSGVVQ